MKIKFIFVSSILIFLLTNNAHAYLDPGTGSIILQAILGFIAAAVTSISIYWTKFKSFFLSKFLKKKENNSNKNK